MDLKQFNSYEKETQSIIFEEMCQLYTIIENNNTTIEDIKSFAEWQTYVNKHGEELKQELRFLLTSKRFYNKIIDKDLDNRIIGTLQINNEKYKVVK